MKRNVLLTALLLAACGDGEKIEVSVDYAASADAQKVAAFRAWVVTGTDDNEASCNLLVAGAQEPYDVALQLLGEGGARFDQPLTAVVRKREGIVYVVAFDYAGEPLYAGCGSVSGDSVNVTLGPLQVYVCSDPTTPDGARCEDGNLCTVGEHCRSGQCTAGTPRNCTQLSGPCTSGACDPNVGCVKVNAPDGQPCNDGLFCTGPDSCSAGTCTAPRLNCPAAPGPCLRDGVCDEQLDRCVYLPKPSSTPCDDGNPCRTGDTCDDRGVCQAGPTVISSVSIECDRNACTVGDQCSSGACTPGTAASGATSCDDGNPCTINDTCSGTTCNAGVSASTSTPCWESDVCAIGDTCSGSGTCSNGFYDSDYDGDGYYRYPCVSYSIDCDDTDRNTHPNATERCGDNKDNDCDGLVDEAGCVPS